MYQMPPRSADGGSVQPLGNRTDRVVRSSHSPPEPDKLMEPRYVRILTADYLDQRADASLIEAERLPEGRARQHALRNAAQLRSFALTKREQESAGFSSSQRG
jgi:hypothetical protein